MPDEETQSCEIRWEYYASIGLVYVAGWHAIPLSDERATGVPFHDTDPDVATGRGKCTIVANIPYSIMFANCFRFIVDIPYVAVANPLSYRT